MADDENKKIGIKTNFLSKSIQSHVDRILKNIQRTKSYEIIPAYFQLKNSHGTNTTLNVFNMNKDIILYAISDDLKNGYIFPALNSIRFMIQNDINWPELYTEIYNNVNEIKKIILLNINRHRLDDLEQLIQLLLDLGIRKDVINEIKNEVKQALITNLKNNISSNGFDNLTKKLIQILKLFNVKIDIGKGEIKKKFLKEFDDSLKYGIIPANEWFIKLTIQQNNQELLNEVKSIIEKNKFHIVKSILIQMKKLNIFSLYYPLSILENLKFTWPEIEIIKTSMKAMSSEINENDEFEYGQAWRNKLEFEELLSTLVHDLKNSKDDDILALDLEDMGFLNMKYELSSKLKTLIENNKKRIIRGILLEVKQAMNPARMLSAISALHNMGIDWPDLKIIKNSLVIETNALLNLNLRNT